MLHEAGVSQARRPDPVNGWLLFALSYRDPADRSVQRAGELEYRHIPLAGPLFQQVRQHPKVNRVLSFLVPSN